MDNLLPLTQNSDPVQLRDACMTVRTPMLPNFIQPVTGGDSVSIATLSESDAITLAGALAAGFLANWSQRSGRPVPSTWCVGTVTSETGRAYGVANGPWPDDLPRIEAPNAPEPMTDEGPRMLHEQLLAMLGVDDHAAAAGRIGFLTGQAIRLDEITSRSPSYEALLIVSQSVAAALDRAGITECDDPGEAIDLLREQAAQSQTQAEADDGGRYGQGTN